MTDDRLCLTEKYMDVFPVLFCQPRLIIAHGTGWCTADYELIISILKESRHLSLRGVFHAFSGSIETFRELQKLGDWYIGIGGVLTYKKASIAETVKQIPLDRILLETDSPYLTPVPFRGKRNESSYIPYIAARLSEQTGRDIAEIAETTTENARKLFRI